MHDIPNMSSWLDRWASYVQPDAVLCYTHYLADSGRALFAGVPRHVVPPPSRLDRRGPAVGREQVRASLGVQPGQVVILCASRLEAWKGHRLLVQALAEMRDEPRWTCWIAGGPQRASEIAYDTALRDEVARLGLSERVHFLGQRTDMPDLLGGADIHCQPNTSPEPFGQVFVEALTAGLPVVTTDMGGGREIVTPDCGILVPPDPASVARSLRRLVVDDTLRTTLAQAAPARAKELCDPATRMHQLADVMVGLAASGLSSGTWRTATASHDPPLVVLVAEALAEMGCTFDDVVDLGCGRGAMARRLAGVYRRYLGCDAVRDPAFPDSPSVRFRAVDLARGPYPVDAASADVVLSATATERLADPRTLLREMARVVRPGGWVLVGAHRALGPPRQEALLRKAAVESGLVDIEVRSDRPSLFPLVAAIWPRGRRPRRRSFAKDLVLLARRP
jgi:SAM-dependent methyltransferase